MIFTTNLDLRFAERLHHHLVVRPQQGRHLLGLGRAVWLTLLLPTLLLEFLDRKNYYHKDMDILFGPFIYQFSQIHDGRGRLVDVPHLLPGEAEHLERLVGELQVLVVVDGLDLGLALGQSEDSIGCGIDQSEGSIHLGDVVVVVDVVAEETLLLELGHGGLHHLVEDVVGALHLLLEGDPRLLQEVRLYVAPGKLPLDVEVDADEFTLNSNYVDIMH